MPSSRESSNRGAEPHVCAECEGRGVPSSNPRLLWCPKCGRAAFDEDVDA